MYVFGEDSSRAAGIPHNHAMYMNMCSLHDKGHTVIQESFDVIEVSKKAYGKCVVPESHYLD